VYALASVNVTRCVLDSNTSSNAGGAISISGSGNTVVVAKTTFSRNSAAFDGGGLYALQSHAFFDSCTFDSNTSGSGGGIAMLLGQLYMLNSTLYQNQALTYGGGMYVASSTASLHNLTLGGNVADSDLDDNGTGGGMYVSSSTMTVMNSVFANLNEGTHGNDDCATSMTTVAFSSGNVLRSIAGCSYTGLVYEADPGLAVLRDNGGPTWTEIPSPSSGLVINGGPAGGCVDWNGFTITVDERGVKRPIGAACDLGAVEVEPIGDANGDGTVDLADVFYVINFLFAGGPVPLGRANVNGGSVIDVADVFYLINYLFAGGPAPI
jgi:predicted outer membrane repeat protein